MAIIKRYSKTSVIVLAVAYLLAPFVATACSTNVNVPGNNGTLKVHEKNTPRNTENNDPKVCTFNFEGYGFDKGQDGKIVISAQSGDNDKSSVKTIIMPAAKETADHSTYTETEYLTLANGHYKSTVYGKDTSGNFTVNLKAKSKVFKVECETPHGSDTSTGTDTGHPSSTSTTVPTSTGAVAGVTSTAVDAQLPAVLPSTGGINPLQIAFNTLATGAGIYAAMLRRNRQ